MGRKGYPAEFRRHVVELVRSGRRVIELADELEISQQTIYAWRNQDEIDRGDRPGLRTEEHVKLSKARRRIKELETELEIHRRATRLLRSDARPKGGTRRSK